MFFTAYSFVGQGYGLAAAVSKTALLVMKIIRNNGQFRNCKADGEGITLPYSIEFLKSRKQQSIAIIVLPMR